MTTATARVGWRLALAEAMQGAGRDWLFVLKACLAVLLTGWIAMRVGLEQPGTAMLTCAIVINPQSGMVLAKSFYRGAGTLVGCGASMLLVALFPQQRVLMLLGLALWLGICAGGASLHRNFKSYGFVLAGYTAGIVILPVLTHPMALFDSALMRVSEVMLGIVVAAVISDVIAPQRLSQALRGSIRAQFTGFVGFVRSSMSGVLERSELEQAHLRFVREVVGVENLRSSVVFEDAGVRVRSPRTRRLNQRFMAASTSYQTLHHLMNRLQDHAHTEAREALMQLFAVVAEALECVDQDKGKAVALQAGTLGLATTDLHEAVLARATQLRADMDRRDLLLDFDTGTELVVRFVDELHDYAQAYVDLAGLTPQRARVERSETRFTRSNDWLGVAFITARTTGVMLVLGWFWVLSAWPSGADAMLNAAIVCGLMASAPNPAKSADAMAKGWILGTALAFVCVFGVMIHMDGFVLFCAGLLPFLMIGFYLYTRPALIPVAKGMMVAFLLMLEPTALMHFSAPQFINRAIGFSLGVIIAGVAFRLFASAVDNRFLYRRMVDKLRAEVVRACHGPVATARQRLESASRDLFMRILGHTPEGSDASRELLGWALSVHETGRAIVELRRDLTQASDPLKPCIRRVVDTMGALYESPGQARYAQARRCLLDALRVADAQDDARVVRHLHLLRLVLLDRRSVLARFMLPEASSVPSGEVLHAA